jgi:acetylornithine deacetylase/succinyl-diaminopimelate desuccinylase-like protein
MTSAGKVSSIYQHPAELLQRLIQFDTTNPPGNESECISFIKGLLTEAGIETNILSYRSERPNLIARLHGQGKASPLLLYGHVDVVTTENQKWSYPVFVDRFGLVVWVTPKFLDSYSIGES